MQLDLVWCDGFGDDCASTATSTAYDCEFVALAMRLGVKLVTTDSKLLKAFPQHAASPPMD